MARQRVILRKIYRARSTALERVRTPRRSTIFSRMPRQSARTRCPRERSTVFTCRITIPSLPRSSCEHGNICTPCLAGIADSGKSTRGQRTDKRNDRRYGHPRGDCGPDLIYRDHGGRDTLQKEAGVYARRNGRAKKETEITLLTDLQGKVRQVPRQDRLSFSESAFP